MAPLSRIFAGALAAASCLSGAAAAAVAAPIHQQQVLGVSGDDGYAEYRLPEYPEHAVRMRKQNDDICDAGSTQYTGWIDHAGKHIFFWYVESLNDPEHDPLNLWMTGGPGCSGLIGMMMELGPCLINPDGNGTHRNPFSWTSNASMIFIDQPAGTGFSYVDEGVDMPADSFIAAADTYIFLRTLLTAFPHLRSLPFHISGESYGGHYVPTVAAEIVRYNAIEEHLGGDFLIQLESVLIGDGFVSPLDTTYGYYETLCTTKPGVAEPIFNATRCALIAEALPRCEYLHEACYAYPDDILCHAADSFCSGQIRALFDGETGAGGRDPFDITRTCEIDQLCYLGVLRIEEYMNTPAVWAALEVPDEVANFSVLSLEVQDLFGRGNDLYVSTAREVRFLLEEGVDVLVYNGNLDLACNTAGNLRWAERMPWSGQADFAARDLAPWYAERDGQTVKAGTMKEVVARGRDKEARFSFVTVDSSGHMVPLDQPEISQQMMLTWISGGSFRTA
ncbi:Carboxypeptidase [Pleurostoma richardsiae]|uniref:Carboxypeptidase n=1 Tax=Pleurostoma richardsiae TaxID=41990 RepID=A0AA38RG34_9PEZI|nr:Carboxypeptidase [Pleurostoma richardsiae]